MLNHERITRSLRHFIETEFLSNGRRLIGDNESLLEDGIIDSLGILEVVTFIEREFSLDISDDEMVADHFESIASLVSLIEHKLHQKETIWTS